MAKRPEEPIPKIWSDLMWAINVRQSLRETMPLVVPNAPPVAPYVFHGFEISGWTLGGMGMVLFGRDPKLDRKVALKLLQSSGPKADAALIAEAQMLAKLSHPNVVTIHAVSEWEGGVFFVMEFVDGMNGQQWLACAPAWHEVLDVFIGAGQGLAAAHDKGIQHHDFKPANILIGLDNRTRVADFGIADYLRVDPPQHKRPSPRRRPGTPEYMAPERLRGHPGDARSDQYSFCASLWRGLHGSRPYSGKIAAELLHAIDNGDLQPPALDPAVPSWLTEVVRKGLAEDPDQRYRNMAELLRALKNEPPEQNRADDRIDADGTLTLGGRVLHGPADAGARRGAWVYVAAGWVSAMLVVLGVGAVRRSMTQEVPVVGEAVERDPVSLIFAAVEEDDFATVERLWSEHNDEITDADELAIAEACMKRAEEIGPAEANGEDAAWAALRIARSVERFGSDAQARKQGHQLVTAAYVELGIDRPSGADVRGLVHHAQPSHYARGALTHPSGPLFHVFGCDS